MRTAGPPWAGTALGKVEESALSPTLCKVAALVHIKLNMIKIHHHRFSRSSSFCRLYILRGFPPKQAHLESWLSVFQLFTLSSTLETLSRPMTTSTRRGSRFGTAEYISDYQTAPWVCVISSDLASPEIDKKPKLTSFISNWYFPLTSKQSTVSSHHGISPQYHHDRRCCRGQSPANRYRKSMELSSQRI